MSVAQSAEQVGVNGAVPAAQPAAQSAAPSTSQRVDYRTEPARYKHWSLTFDGAVATLGINIAEDAAFATATS